MFSFLNSSQKIQHTILNEFYEKRISNSYITLEKKITDKKVFLNPINMNPKS